MLSEILHDSILGFISTQCYVGFFLGVVLWYRDWQMASAVSGLDRKELGPSREQQAQCLP